MNSGKDKINHGVLTADKVLKYYYSVELPHRGVFPEEES
jgi:hypothetical protein